MNKVQKTNKYAHLSEPQKTFDFHGLGILTEGEIINFCQKFLNECLNNKINKALIITGKGMHSQNGESVIKPIVLDFFKNNPQIKKIFEARRDRGGSGAYEIEFQ